MSAKLCVVFPGIGYHCDKPLLYYGQKLARARGYEIVRTSYTKSGIVLNKSKLAEGLTLGLSMIQDALKDVNFTEYDEVLFLSKSIGTAIAAAYEEETGVHDNCRVFRHVMFTPLEITYDHVLDGCGIAFSAHEDQWADFEKVKDLSRIHRIPLFEYPNGNHSLETGDVKTDLATMTDVMGHVADYLDGKMTVNTPEEETPLSAREQAVLDSYALEDAFLRASAEPAPKRTEEDTTEAVEDTRRAYIRSMLAEGYDVTNIAYFIDESEDYVRSVMKEEGLTEHLLY